MAYLGRVSEEIFTTGNKVDLFSGDGVTNTFILSKPVPGSSEAQVTVTVNGLTLEAVTDYQISQVNPYLLTTSVAPANAAKIQVLHQDLSTTSLVPINNSIGMEHLQTSIKEFTNDVFSGNGVLTTFTLSKAPASNTSVLVFVNGVYKIPVTDYTITGTTLTFGSAPVNGAIINVTHLGFVVPVRTVPDGAITKEKLSADLKQFIVDEFTGDNTTVNFTLSIAPASPTSILVSVNGIIQKHVTNYTISGTTLTFTGAPATGANVRVLHLGFVAGVLGIPNGSIDLASKVYGTLPANNGGTGQTTWTAGTDYAKPSVASDWTKPQKSSPFTDNDLSFDLSLYQNFTCTPIAGGAISFTNIASASGQSGVIKLVNTTNYVITKGANVKSDDMFLDTVSATGTYLIGYYSDGTDVWLTSSGALA